MYEIKVKMGYCQSIESKRLWVADQKQWPCNISRSADDFGGELWAGGEPHGLLLHDAHDCRLSIWINKKVSICAESGAIDDIEYAKSETQSGDINRARQAIYTARFFGGIICGNDT